MFLDPVASAESHRHRTCLNHIPRTLRLGMCQGRKRYKSGIACLEELLSRGLDVER